MESVRNWLIEAMALEPKVHNSGRNLAHAYQWDQLRDFLKPLNNQSKDIVNKIVDGISLL